VVWHARGALGEVRMGVSMLACRTRRPVSARTRKTAVAA
jgi:hypothetical protein